MKNVYECATIAFNNDYVIFGLASIDNFGKTSQTCQCWLGTSADLARRSQYSVDNNKCTAADSNGFKYGEDSTFGSDGDMVYRINR